MIVLVTNDDGILSAGVAALAQAARVLGEPRVVAPVTEQSGAGHSVTLAEPLRVTDVARDGKFFGVGVRGTPADCVKLAVRELLPEPPGLILSGVNFGLNLGFHVFYSGTVSAAVEGAMMGIPSVAVSLDWSPEPDFRAAAELGVEVARCALELAAEGDSNSQWRPILNVSVPTRPQGGYKGFRITRQSTGMLAEVYEKREDPRGRDYYWIKVAQRTAEIEPQSDVEAVAAGYVSVTPLHYDLTCRQALRGVMKDAARRLNIPTGLNAEF